MPAVNFNQLQAGNNPKTPEPVPVKADYVAMEAGIMRNFPAVWLESFAMFCHIDPLPESAPTE